jgi:hypothetical protein
MAKPVLRQSIRPIFSGVEVGGKLIRQLQPDREPPKARSAFEGTASALKAGFFRSWLARAGTARGRMRLVSCEVITFR